MPQTNMPKNQAKKSVPTKNTPQTSRRRRAPRRSANKILPYHTAFIRRDVIAGNMSFPFPSPPLGKSIRRVVLLALTNSSSIGIWTYQDSKGDRAIPSFYPHKITLTDFKPSRPITLKHITDEECDTFFVEYYL
jgi:hypothetical protein